MRGIYAVLSIPTSQTQRVQPPGAAAVAVGGQEMQGRNASQFLDKILSYTCDNAEWIRGGVGAAVGVVTIWQILRPVTEVKANFGELKKAVPIMLEEAIQQWSKSLIEAIIFCTRTQSRKAMEQFMEQFLSDYGSFFSFC